MRIAARILMILSALISLSALGWRAAGNETVWLRTHDTYWNVIEEVDVNIAHIVIARDGNAWKLWSWFSSVAVFELFAIPPGLWLASGLRRRRALVEARRGFSVLTKSPGPPPATPSPDA